MSTINLKEPISPSEAKSQAIVSIPSEIFEAVNELLIKYTGPDNKDVSVRIKDIYTRYRELCRLHEGTPLPQQELFDRKYLDIENLYEKAGWKVEYVSPDRGDSDFDSYFSFKPKSKKN